MVAAVVLRPVAPTSLLPGSDNGPRHFAQEVPKLAVPDDIGQQLAAGQRNGVDAAKAWMAAHPDAKPADVVAAAAKQIGLPPAGAAQAADLARVHQAVATRTTDTVEATRWLAKHGAHDLWRDILGEWQKTVSPDQARRGAELLGSVDKLVSDASWLTKGQHDRPRPFKVDPTLPPLHGFVGIGMTGSFPSGHAALAFAGAEVLASLMPERRAEFESMAMRVSYSRVHDAVHFPTDVAAGAVLGAMLATFAIAQPRP